MESKMILDYKKENKKFVHCIKNKNLYEIFYEVKDFPFQHYCLMKWFEYAKVRRGKQDFNEWLKNPTDEELTITEEGDVDGLKYRHR